MRDSTGAFTTYKGSCENYNPDYSKKALTIRDVRLGELYECLNFKTDEELCDRDKKTTPCSICTRYSKIQIKKGNIIMKYKHKITGNIAELTQSGKNYKVTQPQNFTIPSWIIENSSDWEPMNVDYPLEYRDLRGSQYYTTEYTYSPTDTKKYTFKFGSELWYNHTYGKIMTTNSNFNPTNGFHNFRIATDFEKFPLCEKEFGFRIIGMQTSDIKNKTIRAQRQLNGTFQGHPLDTKDTDGSSFKSMLVSGWAISKVIRDHDKQTFELGDTFKAGPNGKVGKITDFSFTHSMNGILITGKVNDDLEVIENLQYCIVGPLSEPLFISDDKVEVREGCKYFGVTENFSIFEGTASIHYMNQYIKRFVYKSLAEDWVIRNKPCLSLVDVSKIYVTANLWDPKNPEQNRKQPKDLYMMVKKKLVK